MYGVDLGLHFGSAVRPDRGNALTTAYTFGVTVASKCNFGSGSLYFEEPEGSYLARRGNGFNLNALANSGKVVFGTNTNLRLLMELR